ncbi:MAG TPA: DAK2 domain-containing protein [Candidatus Limnocylindrales bacterium]|nr:DAK2 domain-containing protein [Candidatus Limnocylindrales bacterium]
MARRSCDGAGFLAAFRSAVARLEANVDEINSLNVFPVPDGDTGTNMLATVRAALDEAEKAGGVAEADRVAHAASFGALMGARGNSGVITSQILAGIAHGLQGKKRFNGLDLAHALDAGTKTAYKAVAKPVEGTILTVIREASAAAIAAAERDNNVETVLVATIEAAERAVAKTPSLLPILREAHVVDSGGQGLLRLFQGALEAARGRPVDELPAPASVRDRTERRTDHVTEAVETGEFGYETVYLLRARQGHPLDIPAIQRHLETIGDSVLVAGDTTMAKIHVHNDRPDTVISYGLSIGTLSRITIENLDGQAHDVREAKASAFIQEGGPAVGGGRSTALVDVGSHGSGAATGDPGTGDPDDGAREATRLPLGVVAVVPSDGLAALFDEHAAGFREFVAIRIVMGGQSANPSTGELLDAVADTPADELLILPNNPNVILAAKQVASMADRPIHVVPTRNVAEGFASLLGLDPSDGVEENVKAMTEASREAQTMQVTEAVRDATVTGRKVKKGQTIALDPDDGLLAVDNDPHKAVLAALGKLEPGFGVITIYYGEGSTLDDAEVLSQRIQEAAPGLEAVDVLHGGQPHYRYLISAE